MNAMLDLIDLTQSLSKEEYKQSITSLRKSLMELQQKVVEKQRPVFIVFEGMETSGKGDSIRAVVAPLDPRGFEVNLTRMDRTPDEKLRPFFRKFWLFIPAKGKISLFDQSWYMASVTERIRGELNDHAWSVRKEEIKQFERQLADDGTIFIKFWLHINKKEQKNRFAKMVKSPYEGWRISKKDWKIHRRFNEYLAVVEEMIVETDTPFAPWTLVAATDRRFRRVQVLRTLVETLNRSLGEEPKTVTKISSVPSPTEMMEVKSRMILDRTDLTRTLTREEYEKQLEPLQNRLLELELKSYTRRLPIVIVYEGWDAAGKGGNIKRLTEKLDPRGYLVIPIAAPQGEEAVRHYLWRFWKKVPKAGHLAIFDRSWYGRVMVERIEGFCREEEWKRAYYEINEFERHLANFGTVLVKFWIHISPEEQLRRFQERQTIPNKKYKITEEDWRNRDQWDFYRAAVNEMIERTSTNYAPWTILEGNCKLWARIKALKTVIAAIEAKLD